MVSLRPFDSALNIPFVEVFGLTPFAIRLLPAILGVVTVGVGYLLISSAAGRRAGILTALFLVVCPWHVMASRWALESNLLPPVMIISVWLLVRAYDNPHRRWPMIFSWAPLALTFYAYAVAIFIVPVFVMLFLGFNYTVVRNYPLRVATSLGIFAITAAPFTVFILVNNVLHRTPSLVDHFPFSVPLLQGSRINEISQNNTLSINSNFIFSGLDDKLPWNVLAPFKPVGPIVLTLSAIGVFFALRRRGVVSAAEVKGIGSASAPSRAYVLPLWLAASIPILAVVPVNVTRWNIIFLPLILLAAVGLDGLATAISDRRTRHSILAILVTLSFAYDTAFYVSYLRGVSNSLQVQFSVGLNVALEKATRLVKPGEPQYISDQIPLNYLYLLFYSKIEPIDFQQNSVYSVGGGQYVVRRYRDYYFSHADPDLAAARSYVAVVPAKGDILVNCDRRTLLDTAGVFVVIRCYSD